MSRARELSRVGSLTGISTVTGIIHADQTNSRVRVGSGITITTAGNIIAAGVVTATSFVGDGSGITNAGSTLSAASGSQRIVVTSQTSGAMTATATDADLTFNAASNTLSVTGGVVATGVSTVSFLQATTVNVSAAATFASNVKVNSLGVGTDASGTAGEIRATNDVTAFYSSDERLKENISPISDALTKLNQISGNTFVWKEGFGEFHSHVGTDCGVIAQEIDALGLPGLVTTRESGYMAVKYEKLTALLIEAVKELTAKVEHLEARCNCGQVHN